MISRRPPWILLLLWLLFAGLYLANLDGWLMHDDEGTDFYEVWQFQQGRQPGVDFLAEQQPLFLLAGRAIVALAGRDPWALRALSAGQLLLGALALALVARAAWGEGWAALLLGLLLSHGLVYEQARLFRPDPMMLAWELAGLAAVWQAMGRGGWRWWLVAGICYGLAVLWKLFGLFPVFALALFFAIRLWQGPGQRAAILRQGLSFALPFALVALGFSAWLYSRLGFYYGDVFRYHAGVERGAGILVRAGRTAVVLLLFLFWNSQAFLIIWPLWWANRRRARPLPPELLLSLVFCLSALALLLLPRPAFVRYFLYLVPALALLATWQLRLSWEQLRGLRPGLARLGPALGVASLALAVALSQPPLPQLLARREAGTRALAAYVAGRTGPEEVVLSDYAGINFLANRRSIYEASGIAGGRIESGALSGGDLMRRIESDDVAMVLLHVAGGDPFPHQLVNLLDYGQFRAYLQQQFRLETVFDRNQQQIEIYVRP